MITQPATNRRPTTTQELLASLHDDRIATLKSLATKPFRVTGGRIGSDDFWTMFDQAVRANGTVDTSALTEPPGDVMHFEPVEIAIVLCGLLVAAFSAGYAAGKDAADTDDADDEAAAEDHAASDGGGDERSSHIRHEQSTVIFAPGRRGLVTRVVTTKLAPRSTDISAQQLLADLRNDRTTTLKRLRASRNWRVVTPPMPTEAVWAFIETSVSAEGTIDLTGSPESSTPSFFVPTDPVALEPTTIFLLVLGATVAAGALGFGVGYAANNNEDPGADDDAAETDQSEGGGDNGGGDTGETGAEGGAGRGVVATAILRTGAGGAVDLTFRGQPLDQR